MANSIGILNEGFKKYESIRPSFEDELYEAMKSLTERQQEWSDEDKHDNEILWGIRDKWQKRINAKLTPEEKEIIKKYNIGEPYRNFQNELRVFSTDEKGLNDGNELFTNAATSRNRRWMEPNKQINVADRARKTVARAKSKDNWNDDIRKYQSNYDDMKNALVHRDNAAKDLDNLESGNSAYDKRIKNLQNDLDNAIKDKEWQKKYEQQKLKDSQDKINKLLKKDESLSKKRMNESASDDYYDLTHNIAETAANIKKENPDMEMSDCVFEAIDQQLIYYADQWVVLQEFANPLDLFTEEIWDDFYNDIYGKVDEYLDDEDLEESLKSKKK